MTIAIEKARGVYDYVRRACIQMFETVKAERDEAKNHCLMFLVRAVNAADASRVLFENGFELEARGVQRILVEAYVEFSFITSDSAELPARMKLFFDHAAYGRFKEARAIANLHGMPATDPALKQLEADWDAVKANYPPKQPWNWCDAFSSLSKRAKEAGRVFDLRKEKETGMRSSGEYVRHFERTYELAYAEGCMAAHVSPGSFYEIPDSLIGPVTPTDGRTLSWAAWMLATLADAVGLAVNHLPESTLAKSVEMIAPSRREADPVGAVTPTE
jgi:hypothetical protein